MDISSNPITTASVQPLEPKTNEIQVSKPSPLDDKVTEVPLTLSLKTNVAHTTFDMRLSYFNVQKDIQSISPDLMEKDWDFSVDKAGELVILEGNDKLSEEDIGTITQVLQDNGIDKQMDKLANEIVDWGAGLRGPNQTSKENIGKHDISRENFSEIIKGRELMSSTSLRVEKGLDYYEGKAIAEYNSGKINPLEAISMQVQARALVVYDR